MELTPAKCTQCGAQISVDKTKDAGVCPYCGTAYITEKAINLYQTTNNYNIQNATINIVNQQSNNTGSIMSLIKCPSCGSSRCQIINEVKTEGSNYSAEKGCCGVICFGPIGFLCGLCGEGKKTVNTHYWICHDCGKKWKA